MTAPAVSTAVIWALPDLAQEPVLVAAAPAAGLRIVRRCVDAADLLANASIDTMTTVVVSDGVPRLDGDIVRRLASGQRQVIGVARTATGASRLRAWGASAVVEIEDKDATGAVARIARACQDAAVAKRPRAALDIAPSLEAEAESEAEAEPDTALNAASATTPKAVPNATSPMPAHKAASTAMPPPMPQTGTPAIIAVWAPPGSPGCTTTAIGMADELARQGRRVLLVDADVRSPSMALVLGIADDTGGLLLATRQADHGLLSPPALIQTTREYRKNLAVLTGLARPDRRSELRTSALDAIWTHARAAFDVTVVDLGAPGLAQSEPLPREPSLLAEPDAFVTARSALAAADAVVVVARGDALGLSRLALARLPHASSALAVVDPPRRANARVLDVIVDIGLHLPAVRVDWDGAWADAMHECTTLAETRPRSRTRRAYRAIADHALATAMRTQSSRTQSLEPQLADSARPAAA